MKGRGQVWAQIALAAIVVWCACVAVVRADPMDRIAVCYSLTYEVDSPSAICNDSYSIVPAGLVSADVAINGDKGNGYVYAPFSSYAPTDICWINDANGLCGDLSVGDFGVLAGAVSGGGGGGQAFDIADLDQATLGQLFGVGFLLVTTAWGIGKGVALVLRMVK